MDNTSNRVEVSGRIISIKSNNNGSNYITILTRNGRDAFLRFFCPKSVPVDGYKLRARVSVTGRVASTHRKDSRTGKWVTDQFFVADDIRNTPTLTETAFGVKGKFFPDMDAKIYIHGTIENIKDDSEWIRYIVKVDDKTTVRLNMKRLDRQPNIKVGDEIYTVCSVSTPKKNLNGRDVYFEDIIISDIATM